MTIYSQVILHQIVISYEIKGFQFIKLELLHYYEKSMTELMKWFKP
jgi:hypothetical protein